MGNERRSHMVNIITLPDGQKFMVDVGFGANGPIRPLPLVVGSVHKAIPPAEARLVYDGIPAATDPSQKSWIFQHRDRPDAEWIPQYCFTETEFLPQDYEIMNFWTSQSRTSFFTYRVVVVKMIMEGKKVVGTVTLSGEEIKRRIRGESEMLRICKSEEERAEALDRWFGIRLTADERRGIVGMVSELKG